MGEHQNGRVTNDTNAGFQPFGFAGGLDDPFTGLVRFGRRDYSPVLGRWLAKDPIGFGGGDANVYAYCGNDPVNYFDATGFDKTKLIARIVELTERGMKTVGEMLRSKAAVEAAQREEDLLVKGRATARDVAERASNGEKPIHHDAHVKTAGPDARPHYHPAGKKNHIFYSIVPLFDIDGNGKVDLDDAAEILDLFGPVFILPPGMGAPETA